MICWLTQTVLLKVDHLAGRLCAITSQGLTSGGAKMLANFEQHSLPKSILRNYSYIAEALAGKYEFASSSHSEDFIETFNAQLSTFTQQQEITKALVQRRNGIIKHLTKILTNKFINAKLTSFGSFESGLSLTNGDIDLCLEFDGEPPKKVLPRNIRKNISKNCQK